jgi:hypothetical protein
MDSVIEYVRGNWQGLAMIGAALLLLSPDIKKLFPQVYSLLGRLRLSGGAPAGGTDPSPEQAFAAMRLVVAYYRKHGCEEGLTAAYEASRHLLDHDREPERA